jgi:sulfate adenylyltransferase (ADP) / ATP adenylyltransferase
MDAKSNPTPYVAGLFWQKAAEVSASARQSGALSPIDSRGERIFDGAIEFVIRIASEAARKRFEASRARLKADPSLAKINPFLPYDERLFVSDISDTHFCLLNKFQLLDNHVLLVTRTFEPQETLLTVRDFEALWQCLMEGDAFGFYNAGPLAGASQSHKHLQLISLPITDAGPRLPIECAFDDLPADGSIAAARALPFSHRALRQPFSPADSPRSHAARCYRQYRALLEAIGLNRVGDPERCAQVGPYNLLITRQWMVIVPRTAESYQSIPINALGFAGTIFVRKEEQAELLRKVGPLTALRSVT